MAVATTKRFTIAEYHRLVELGFFHEDDRTELIRGVIIQMAAKSTAHTVCCSNLLEALARLLANRATLRCQDPVTLPSGSEPEPDFTIVRQRSDNYLSGHPAPADILLVIEIAESSLDYDRDVKRSLYAEANISDYWIFNLIDNCLETYSEPYQDLQSKFDYAVRRIILLSKTVTLPGFPELQLNLSKTFPTPSPQ
ncbi:MAG: Uma2 family endonuclease [Leptolyngbyaceae cyanobacterium RU_5_1]|nr:Uma2 family endonuclease [Leptolyngbyaceae cyanobacterium RU_5_1]